MTLAVARRLDEVRRQELRGGRAAETGQKAEAALQVRLTALERKKLETWRQEVQAKVDALRQELREAALRISGSVNQRLEELKK